MDGPLREITEVGGGQGKIFSGGDYDIIFFQTAENTMKGKQYSKTLRQKNADNALIK